MNMPMPQPKASQAKAKNAKTKPKPVTAEKLWSDHILSTEGHLWAEGGDDSGTPMVYRWNGTSYDLVAH